jgi:hypothetical protein
MTASIHAGLMFERCAKVWTVTGIRTSFRKVIAEAADGDVAHIDIDEFMRESAEGTILRVVRDRSGTARPIAHDWKQRERTSARDERLRREAILAVVQAATKAGKTLTQAEEDIAELCKKMNWKQRGGRTLRSWRKQARADESRLSPSWDRCGNHRQGPDELLLQAMEGVFKATLAVNDRFTTAAAWKLVVPKYHDLCEKHGQAPRRHGIQKLKQYLLKMPWSDLMLAQLDGRTARNLTRTTSALNTADLFWDVVEMDATHLPIILRDESRERIGCPILYLAVDVATGYPVGLHLTILKPSVAPFVECLRFMYFPKPEGFDKKYGIRHRIEVFGKPVVLKVDNGSEFIGEAATAVVHELHGDSARCTPMTPQEKPHVERLNGTIKQFIRTLPGSTKSATLDEPRIVPAGEELLTLEELEGRIFREIYDGYVFRTNVLRSWKNRKAVGPYDIWMDMSKSHFPPFPVSRREFELSMYFKRERRVLNHDGIAFDGLTYHSAELGALYARTGSGMLDIRYAEGDAEIILVLPPDGGEAVTAYGKELQGIRVDRATAKLIRGELTAAGRPLDRRGFQQTLAELEAHEKTSAKTLRGKNKKARVEKMMNDARDAIRPTMPTPAQAQGSPPGTTGAAGGWDFAAGSLMGRKRGGR